MNKLRQLRKEKGLTLIEMSERVNINKTSIARYETGEVEMKADTVKMLSDFFQVSSDYLLGKTNVRNPVSASSPSKIEFALHGYEDDLTDDDKDMILQMAKSLAEKNKK